MKKSIIVIAFICSFIIGSKAQPLPAVAQSEPILIMNATAHIGNGKVIEKALIAFENGKITIVDNVQTSRIDMSKFKKVINAAGNHVYPGMISMSTDLGLVEIIAVRQTVDHTETGDMNPSVRSIVAYNTDSQVPPTVRSNGILLAQITPNGGRISGQSSVVELDAWNWEDAAYKFDEGVHVNFPALFSGGFDFLSGGFAQRKNENFAKQITELEQFFSEAKAYAAMTSPSPKNLKFEAMRDLFSQKKTLYIHANLVKEITEGVLFGKKMGCKTVIVGGRDAYLVTDILKSNNVAVILDETQALPARVDDDIDQPFKSPAMLKAAGIPFTLSVNGHWQQRNLPLMAGQAVAFGLGYEDAVTAVTLEPAKILGIDKTVGSLEEGKDATLIITEGDVFDMRTSKVKQAFIRGKEIDLTNKQTDLYKRFKTKYDRLGGK
ncbi:MAG: amidohydrolase family protein [Saprospiraceae bacterium]|nr:amidohydrolase family protein [Saprospiraceae bacterium]